MINQNDIANKEEIGTDGRGNKIWHVLTKGGLSIIGKMKPSGQLDPIATGSHPAIARHSAQNLDKSIQYSEHLYKAEGATDQHGITIQRFSPEAAHQLAVWHSKMAGKHSSDPQNPQQGFDQKMKYLYHTDAAIKNYQASGANHNMAKKLHEHNSNLHHELSDLNPPHDQMALEQAYQRTHGKPYPKGIDTTYGKK